MTQLNLMTTVGQWVALRPQTARVFEDLRMDYCCGGDKSLEEACRARQLDPQVIFEKLESAIGTNEQPAVESWVDINLELLCNHIEETHHAFLRRALPRLTHLIAKVVAAHADRYPELNDVEQVFRELREELEPHMMKEERVLFPAIRQLERSSDTQHFPFGSVVNPVTCMKHEHDVAGTALARLRELTDDYQPPHDACATYRVMLHALAQLEADMHQHIHKENNILFPRAICIESERARV